MGSIQAGQDGGGGNNVKGKRSRKKEGGCGFPLTGDIAGQEGRKEEQPSSRGRRAWAKNICPYLPPKVFRI